MIAVLTGRGECRPQLLSFGRGGDRLDWRALDGSAA
jgi:hypothetical protein